MHMPVAKEQRPPPGAILIEHTQTLYMWQRKKKFFHATREFRHARTKVAGDCLKYVNRFIQAIVGLARSDVVDQPKIGTSLDAH